jgi:DNA-binding transcriptional LysR family regulator
LESFFAVAQMALAGFGHGLVPVGVARTLAVPMEQILELDKSGLTRPVRFVARKSMFSQELVRSFYNEVSRLAGEIEGD